MLEVRLLGKFEIKCDGEPIIISSRAAQSLFAYLILTAGTLHRREKLAGMFWPDVTENKARRSLRQELWRIRKALASQTNCQYLIADDIAVSFNSNAAHHLDVRTLVDLSEHASIDELMNSLSAFQGELLPGFYDEWIILEREHLQVLYEQKMTRLLQLLENEKRWPQILEWAERWISLGQDSEAAYQALMTAYNALGDRSKVAATYERCAQALRALDLEPSERTRALLIKRNSSLNIPIPLTSFIGREQELREVADLISRSRLVTLTGPGGVGKTRLAIQVVAEVLELFPDGVWFLDLAPLSDPSFLPNTCANVLGLRESTDPKLSITDQIKMYLQPRTGLIIFDNCEHLIESCALLVDSLLRASQNLRILATSREALMIAGEISYRVPSLAIPSVDIEAVMEALTKTESVRLFIERAAAISSGFLLRPQNALFVAQICQRLDGIPLAIELAAARTNTLTVEQISNRLDDRFNLLTRGLRTSLPRHQTLRAAIEWSYDLLLEKERLLFRRLAVFVGGWTLEAAEEVCSGNGLEVNEVLDLLSQLVNKSLISVETWHAESRYHRLETVRQFAREKLLESGETELLSHRHLEYFLRLAETAEPYLIRTEQIEWSKRLEAEHDNLRAALAWSMSETSAEPVLRLASCLGYFWDMRGYYPEGAKWLDQVLSRTWNEKSKAEKAARAKAFFHRAEIADTIDERDVLKIAAESALMLYEEVGDLSGIALSRALSAFSQLFIGISRARVRTLLEQSLNDFQRLGNVWGEANVLVMLGYLLLETGPREELLKTYQCAADRAREAGDRKQIAFTLLGLAVSAFMCDEWDEAERILLEAEQLYAEIDSSDGIAHVHHIRTDIYFASGNLEKAKAEAKLAVEGWQRVGERNFQSHMLFRLALIAEAESDFSTALKYAQKALVLRRNIGTMEDIPFGLALVGRLEYKQGNIEIAIQYLDDSLEIMRRGEVGNRELISILVYLSELFLEKKTQVAVQILALAESLAQLFPLRGDHAWDKRYSDRYLSVARARLSKAEFKSAWEVGTQMAVDQAADYMLRALQ